MYRLYAVLVVGLLGVTAIDRASEFLARKQNLELEALRAQVQGQHSPRPDMAAPGPDGAASMEAK